MATVTSPERIREEEVSHFPRIHGQSKYGLSRTFKVLLDLLSMYFFVRFRASPGHFFGRIGLACGFAGMLALGWLAWLKLGLAEPIASRPLLLLAVLLVVIGVQFVCTGIVTEMLARTYFEAGTARTYLVRETLGTAGAMGTAAAGPPAPSDRVDMPRGGKPAQGEDGPRPGGDGPRPGGAEGA
jgi:hypothetical protein